MVCDYSTEWILSFWKAGMKEKLHPVLASSALPPLELHLNNLMECFRLVVLAG